MCHEVVVKVLNICKFFGQNMSQDIDIDIDIEDLFFVEYYKHIT